MIGAGWFDYYEDEDKKEKNRKKQELKMFSDPYWGMDEEEKKKTKKQERKKNRLDRNINQMDSLNRRIEELRKREKKKEEKKERKKRKYVSSLTNESLEKELDDLLTRFENIKIKKKASKLGIKSPVYLEINKHESPGTKNFKERINEIKKNI